MSKLRSESKSLTAQQVMELHSMTRNRLEGVQQQLGTFNSFLQDLVNAKASIEQLEQATSTDPVMFSLSAGVFVSANLDKKPKFLITIGDEIYHATTPENAKQKLDARKEDLLKAIASMQLDQEKLIKNLQDMESMLNQARRKAQLHPETTPAVS
ncbi:MAG: prefoldin subunit alpha [Candidatus Diapherotrites archaeon]|nr:prefoldin subunit alpha [Candidatus Diapherotrites archaeon]